MTTDKLYQLFIESSGVCTDTRQLKKGQLFFALSGPNFNGNQFASSALAQGAKACIIDDENYVTENCHLVKDTLEALQNVARFHRQKLGIPIIGLTGSNGKTTSKELLAAALSSGFKVNFTQGNLNNHIGVPLSLLRVDPNADFAIIEMGANAQKEIEFLSSICQPDIGFITNFGKAHLEGFGGPEGVIKGKSELYDFLRENQKLAFVNIQDEKQIEKSQGIKTLSFGNSPEADFYIQPKESESDFVEVSFQGTTIKTQLTGNYNFGNIAVAIAIASHFGLSAEQIKSGIEAYIPSNNRSQINRVGTNTLVKDYYNANPSSMQVALENFAKLAGETKWVVLGDMFELGESELEEHQAIVNLANELNFDQVFLVGKRFSKCESKGAVCYSSTEEALEKMPRPENCSVLLKGSRSMQLEKLLELFN